MVRKYDWFVLVFFIFFAGSSLAQSITMDAVVPGGDYFHQANGSLSWTLGEVSAETYSAAGAKLTQGFQQGHFLFASVRNTIPYKSDFVVFPNPFLEQFSVDLNAQNGPFRIEIYDLAGRLIKSEKHDTSQPLISMEGMATGSYLLKLVQLSSNKVSNAVVTKVSP